MRLERLRSCWLVVLGLLASGGPLPGDDRITVECRINGQPVTMAIDTGAETIVLFESVAQRLRLKLTPPPADARPEPGEVLVSRTEPLKFEVVGLASVDDTKLMVLDHPSYLPTDIDGVIGWSNIRKNRWRLGGGERSFRLIPEIPAETATWLPVREHRQTNTLTWELPSEPSGTLVRLGVDTGADSGVRLSAAAWADWRKTHPLTPVTLEAYFMPGAGLVVAEYAWADEIALGSLTLHGVTVTSMNLPETQRQAPATLAVLGFGALLRLDSVIDGPNDRAFLNPLRGKPHVPAHNRLGAIFAPNNPNTDEDLVAHVAANSPAAQAGIRDGDVLLKVDQLDVTHWRTQPGILPLRRFFIQPAGTKLQLTVRRGGQTLVCPATLRNILGPGPGAP